MRITLAVAFLVASLPAFADMCPLTAKKVLVGLSQVEAAIKTLDSHELDAAREFSSQMATDTLKVPSLMVLLDKDHKDSCSFFFLGVYLGGMPKADPQYQVAEAGRAFEQVKRCSEFITKAFPDQEADMGSYYCEHYSPNTSFKADVPDGPRP